MRLLRTHPLRTNAGTAAVVTFAGDGIAQRMEHWARSRQAGGRAHRVPPRILEELESRRARHVGKQRSPQAPLHGSRVDIITGRRVERLKALNQVSATVDTKRDQALHSAPPLVGRQKLGDVALPAVIGHRGRRRGRPATLGLRPHANRLKQRRPTAGLKKIKATLQSASCRA